MKSVYTAVQKQELDKMHGQLVRFSAQEHAAGHHASVTYAWEVHRQARRLMAEHPDMDYGAALLALVDERPDLMATYWRMTAEEGKQK